MNRKSESTVKDIAVCAFSIFIILFMVYFAGIVVTEIMNIKINFWIGGIIGAIAFSIIVCINLAISDWFDEIKKNFKKKSEEEKDEEA